VIVRKRSVGLKLELRMSLIQDAVLGVRKPCACFGNSKCSLLREPQ
jgi:hypothetical protein